MRYPLPDRPSIAVLPFINISGDPKQEHLADGITEEITNTLSRVPFLFVIASNTGFTYKGKRVKIQQVSEELGVRYVVEGSLQRSHDRLRVTAQLIDAPSGHHLWSERYDRMLKEIFTRSKTLNPRGRFNLGINISIGLGYLVTALSGIYFLFIPGGRSAADPVFLFSRQTWDILHTWGGVTLILAAIIHFAIHWNWVIKVTRGILLSIHRSPRQSASDQPAAPLA